jgi:hypothetical protein
MLVELLSARLKMALLSGVAVLGPFLLLIIIIMSSINAMRSCQAKNARIYSGNLRCTLVLH